MSTPAGAQAKRPIPVLGPRKSGLTRLQLVLLGKGRLQATRPVNCPPWRGSADRAD